MDAVEPIPDQHRGQIEIGRRADGPDFMFQIPVNYRRFQGRVVGAVNEVDAERAVAQPALEIDHGRLHRVRRKPGGSEKADHPRSGHGRHHPDGCDPVGHGPGNIGEPEPMPPPKPGISEVFRRESRGMSQKGKAVGRRPGPVAQDRPASFAHTDSRLRPDHKNRLVEPEKRGSDGLRARPGRSAVRLPVPLNRRVE